MKQYTNKLLYNIAADIVVNQYIQRKQLPEGGILMEQFAYLEPMYGIVLDKDKDVGYYYRQLDKIFKNQSKMNFENAVNATNPIRSNGETQVNISKLLSEANEESIAHHQYWEEFEKMSEGERKIAEYQANRMIKETACLGGPSCLDGEH